MEMEEKNWGVVERRGVHSFSNLVFGADPVRGAGEMSYQEAAARAAKVNTSPRVQKAKAFWDAYMSW